MGPSTQFRALAKMRATVVLPTPRGPVKQKAWARRPDSRAPARVRVTCFLAHHLIKGGGAVLAGQDQITHAPLQGWGG